MTIKNTQLIKCDHMHRDGEPCGMERATTQILPTEPMYRVELRVTAIDREGESDLTSMDIHCCYWDLFYVLSQVYDLAKTSVEQRKANEAAARDTDL